MLRRCLVSDKSVQQQTKEEHRHQEAARAHALITKEDEISLVNVVVLPEIELVCYSDAITLL